MLFVSQFGRLFKTGNLKFCFKYFLFSPCFSRLALTALLLPPLLPILRSSAQTPEVPGASREEGKEAAAEKPDPLKTATEHFKSGIAKITLGTNSSVFSISPFPTARIMST
jgi:hypothetical protein